MSGPVVLALDFGGSKIALAAAELDGTRIAAATVAVERELGAAGNLAAGIAAGRGLLAEAAPDRPLAAVGACTFGIPTGNGVELAPNIDGWEALRLEDELRGGFGEVPVRLANDVKAAAAAEARWGALVDCDPGIYLNLGTGLSVGIVSGGQVLEGAHGAAGEIAYNLRSLADVGRPIEARTLLEQVVSGRAVTSRLAGEQQTGEDDVLTLVGTEVRQAFLAELAYHVVNLAIALDPARIAVGGGLVHSWGHLGPALRQAVRSGVPYPPEIVPAAFPNEAPLFGALALAVAAARETEGVAT